MNPPRLGLRNLMGILLASAPAWALSLGCTPDVGQVELSWIYVDRDVEPYYPSDDRTDTCAISGRDGQGPVPFDLLVRLTISSSHCAEGPQAAVCQVVEPAHFRCDRRRGTVDDVPTTGEPYLMTVDVVVAPPPDRGSQFVPAPHCASVPAPRHRTVRAGHLADLSVYQFVLHNMDVNDDDLLPDLEHCREPKR